jgi:predicted DCC family thiol-disulfide oxidoreductase YuxK
MAWTLFYDGGCNLCHTNKLRAERWAENAGQPMRAIPLQSVEGLERGYDLTTMVLEADGAVFQGADAWLKLCSIGPWTVRWLAPLGKIGLFRALLHWGYGIVAKYRYKWFGTRACQIPTKPTP